MKKATLIVSVVIVFILSFVRLYEQKREEEKGIVLEGQVTKEPEANNSFAGDNNFPSEQAPIATIRCYICGKVKEPEVYSLPEGSRVIDFVEAAGGFLEDAAKEYVNLAGMVNDGDKIYIPSLEEVTEQDIPVGSIGGGTIGESASNSKVNINTADVSGLMTLPGIGESKAKAIVKYRKDHGKYTDAKDLLNVSGIGESTFENIKEYIIVK